MLSPRRMRYFAVMDLTGWSIIRRSKPLGHCDGINFIGQIVGRFLQASSDLFYRLGTNPNRDINSRFTISPHPCPYYTTDQSSYSVASRMGGPRAVHNASGIANRVAPLTSENRDAWIRAAITEYVGSHKVRECTCSFAPGLRPAWSQLRGLGLEEGKHSTTELCLRPSKNTPMGNFRMHPIFFLNSRPWP